MIFIVAAALAVAGGLVLNLMPCVLPVLSLKLLSLVEGGGDRSRARRGALAYTAGVVVSFAALGAAVLALRGAGHLLGWGFQLQQPLVVVLLAWLMFALALSLSGVWHVGGSWTGIGQEAASKGGLLGDFFTGVLAVVVATPCTAPFMGASMAWAFTAPAAEAMTIFVALGVGLAAPFLLVGFVPALARFLPRPGAWMETLKEALAFPLYLTAVWLSWVLARMRGVDALGWALAGAVLVAFAAWSRTSAFRTGQRAYAMASLVALLALLLPMGAIWTAEKSSGNPTAAARFPGDG